ncbi:MAG: NADP-dependent malic enzyme [Gammaproteobacteria bacterium]|nr:NADP-dependent malic enzyme [Gammaproteobacteria bacterium]MBL7001033.1 NADP-dependent malic enzyme [Gammaproteobacteria bacterium]
MSEDFREKALEYHQFPTPGKLCIQSTVPLTTQRDLALAYSPGVAYACEEIEKDPLKASDYTARANLVGVITNGTAVLGLGAIGPLASKPVMEGKAVLFKKFANIDVFDIEIKEEDPIKLAQTIERLEPTFGGINLEDIKAPECFIVEEYLRKHMSIPVFHDDQHGTAIVVAAALTSALELVGKPIDKIKLVSSGAGAAALACLNLLVSMGLPRENVIVTDIDGVVYKGRVKGADPYKDRYAVDTPHRTLADAIAGADVFLGLSAANVLKPAMLKTMAEQPVVFALANPNPEINPLDAVKVRDDLIIATGRSDFPNQVNNVLCFPFLFRGALDVGATEINEEMKIAAVHAISRLARAGSTSDIVSSAYAGQSLRFGREYLIPKPFDPRLIIEIASAVAQAAMDSGVATRPIANMAEYRDKLTSFVYRSGLIMKPVFELARNSQKKVVFPEGENLKVLQAVENIVQDRLAFPILLGRPEIIKAQISEYGLSMQEGRDFQIIYDTDVEKYASSYYQIMHRRGVTLMEAESLVLSSTTLQAALMVKLGEADTFICGSIGRFNQHLKQVMDVAEQPDGEQHISTLNVHILNTGTIFICDTQVTVNPAAEDIAQMAIAGAREVERFGIKPQVALLSHSNFGNRDSASARKMREALAIIRKLDPTLEVDGEMQAESALSAAKRGEKFADSNLQGAANLLVMPNLDAGNITSSVLHVLGGGVSIGPILMGCKLAGHVVNSSISVRGLVNMTVVAVAQTIQAAN